MMMPYSDIQLFASLLIFLQDDQKHLTKTQALLWDISSTVGVPLVATVALSRLLVPLCVDWSRSRSSMVSQNS